MKVFEWGAGGSTLFFCRKVLGVVSVEHDAEWVGRVKDRLASQGAANVSLRLIEPDVVPYQGNGSYTSGAPGYEAKSFASYCQSIDGYGMFNLILIDGRARLGCLERAIAHVEPGGYLMLDNSDYDRYQTGLGEISVLLKRWPRSDFLAPGPCSVQIGWATTLWRRPWL
jgi:hypothetical protein